MYDTRQQRGQYIWIGLGLWAAVGTALVVMAAVAPSAASLNVQTQSQIVSRVATPLNIQTSAGVTGPYASYVAPQTMSGPGYRVPVAVADTPFQGPAFSDVQPTATTSTWTLVAALSAAILSVAYFFKRSHAQHPPMYGEFMDVGDVETGWSTAAVLGEAVPLTVKSSSGAAEGSADLNLPTAGENSRHVIHRKLVAELANRRQANAHTKTRGEVSGGGKKPYKQKGTGNARRGSNRSPLMRHGGVSFGPRNTKNYKQKINKKEGRLAISSLLQNRAPLITVIKDLETSVDVISTSKAAEMIESWKDKEKGDKVLLIVDMLDNWNDGKNPLALSTRNMPMVRLMNQQLLSVADLLWPHQIFMSQKALESLKVRYGASAADAEESA